MLWDIKRNIPIVARGAQRLRTPVSALLAAAVATWAIVAIAGVKLVEDPPLVRTPKAGTISGSFRPADKVVEVWAAHRNSAKTYKPFSFDKATGRFAFCDLPGDETYDLGAKTADGRVVEGIDLRFVDQRLTGLAEIRRKQLGLPAAEGHEFSRDDADELLKFASDLKPNDFMDQGRVLYLAGDGGRATMLVELMRLRDFYDVKTTASGKQLIWRVELWYFEYQYGGWERVPNQERVLRRERIPSGDWQKISVEYLPAMSVHVDKDGKSAPVTFTLPDKPDPATGRPANTDPKLQTKPRILGVQDADEALTQPATRPAR